MKKMLVLISLIIIIGGTALIGHRYYPVVDLGPSPRVPVSKDVAWAYTLASYFEEVIYRRDRVRIPISVKYLILSRKIAAGNTIASFDDGFIPKYLDQYGIIPEIAMPTKDDNNYSKLSSEDVNAQVSQSMILSAKDFYQRKIVPTMNGTRADLYLDESMKGKSIPDGDICRRNEIYKYVTVLPSLITYLDGTMKGGVLFNITKEADEFIYKVIIDGEVRSIPKRIFKEKIRGLLTTREQMEVSEMFFRSDAIADVSEKPTILYFSQPGCPPCAGMREAMIDLDVKKLAGQYRIIKLDKWEDRELADKYLVKGVPSLIFIGPDQNEIKRVTGFYGKQKLLDDLKGGLK